MLCGFEQVPWPFCALLSRLLRTQPHGKTQSIIIGVNKLSVLRGMPSLASCGKSSIWRNPLKAHLQSLLAPSCTCGGEVSLTGRRDRACSVQPLLFWVSLPTRDMILVCSSVPSSRSPPSRGHLTAEARDSRCEWALWIKCLCWTLNPQCAGVGRCGLCEGNKAN